MKLESLADTKQLARLIAANITGGEFIELIGDVGAGKTTFTKDIIGYFEVNDEVQSPTFTLSREYKTNRGLRFVHFDLYRLDEPGIMEQNLHDGGGR